MGFTGIHVLTFKRDCTNPITRNSADQSRCLGRLLEIDSHRIESINPENAIKSNEQRSQARR